MVISSDVGNHEEKIEPRCLTYKAIMLIEDIQICMFRHSHRDIEIEKRKNLENLNSINIKRKPRTEL